MNLFSYFFSKLHFYRSLNGIIDDRLRENEVMTMSDFLEFHYNDLSQHSSESGISEDTIIPGHLLIVSLTSHGSRIHDCHLAIETIMQGTIKPNRIILWLPEDSDATSSFIHNQVKRGLEIRYVKDWGPHTKLIPALQEFPNDIIVTIDDDMFYKSDMLENLVRAYQKDSSTIHANRVAVMTKDRNGNVESYLNWKQYLHPDTTTSMNVIIGSEGCLYPPKALSHEVFDEASIRELCPTADDIWFTAMALLKGTSISHVESHYQNACAGGVMNLRMQNSGLVHQNENPKDCRNDIQIRAVFGKYNLYPLIG